MRLLFDEVTTDTDPLGPDNVVIIDAGPLVGTLAPICGRWIITSKSAMTRAFGDTNAGGHFGSEMKFAGCDHIIIKGRDEIRVYVLINDDTVEIRNADHLWGKTCWETDNALKEEPAARRARGDRRRRYRQQWRWQEYDSQGNLRIDADKRRRSTVRRQENRRDGHPLPRKIRYRSCPGESPPLSLHDCRCEPRNRRITEKRQQGCEMRSG